MSKTVNVAELHKLFKSGALKVNDPRARAYVEKYGDQSWEVDALTSSQLRALITTAVRRRVDLDELVRVLREEEEGKKKLRSVLGKVS